MATKPKVGQIKSTKPRFEDVADDGSQFEGTRFYDLAPAVQDQPKQAPERSMFGAINDTMINTANSAVGLVKSGVDLVSPDSELSGAMSDFIRSGREKQSDKQKYLDLQLQKKLAVDSENDGSTMGKIGSQLSQAGTYIGHGLTTDPLKLAGETFGNLGPFRVVGGAMQAAGFGEGIRTLASSALAGGLSVGEVRGNIWDKINGTPDDVLYQQSPEYSSLRDAGVTEQDAKQQLGANFTRNLPELAINGAVGAISGKYGVEGMAAGVFPKMGRIASGIVGGIDEGVVQGGTEQLTSNYGVRRAIPTQSLDEGVGLNMAMEGMPGVAMGLASGGHGAAHTNQPAPTPQQKPTLQIGNTPDPMLITRDGTIARKSEFDAYVNSLPPDQQPAARAKLMGLAPQPSPADQLRATKVPTTGPMSAAVNAGIEGQAQEIDLVEAAKQEYRDAMAALELQAKQAEEDRINALIEQSALEDQDNSDAAFWAGEAPLENDIVNPSGKPFKTKMAATVAAKKADGEVVPVAGGFVVRVNPQPTTLGTQTNAIAGPAFGVDAALGMSNVKDAAQGTNPPAVEATGKAPQAVEGNAATTSELPTAGSGAVEGTGMNHPVAPVEQAQVDSENVANDAEIENLKRIETINQRQKLGLNVAGMASDRLIESGRLPEVTQPNSTPAAHTQSAPIGVTPQTDAPIDNKAKWLKAINDQNRLAGDTGVQLSVASNGKLTFLGGPNATKQGRALAATLDEALNAGATHAEIIASINAAKSHPQGTNNGTQAAQTVKTTQEGQEAPAAAGVTDAEIDAHASRTGESKALILQRIKWLTQEKKDVRKGLEFASKKAEESRASAKAESEALEKTIGSVIIKGGKVYRRVKTQIGAGTAAKDGAFDSYVGDVGSGAANGAITKAKAEGKSVEGESPVAKPVTPQLPPAAPVAKKGIKARIEQDRQERADYFTPGNIVQAYGGHDEVLSYTPPKEDGSGWSVKVHAVKKVNGEWVRIGKPQDARTHSTQPDAQALKAGPLDKVKQAAAADVPYTEPRADGAPFPNAHARGVAVEQVPDADEVKRFYVTMIRGSQVARLAGPFDTKEQAEVMVDRAREEANKADPRSAFDAFGVSGVTEKEPKPGVLNAQLGIGLDKSEPPKVSAKEQARALRETETATFNSMVSSVELSSKSEAELTDALKARLPGSKPEQLAKMAKELHKQLSQKADELAKDKHRDPAVYKAAVDGALLKHGIDGDADKTNRFQAGWAHALAGKTKSTMSGDMLADQVRGYEGAKEWMKTEEGAAWYEGRPVSKLQNTGIDLRRHWEAMQAQMKANESDINKAWKQIERSTARADLFAPLLPDDAKPGFKLYVTDIRSNLITFKDWLEDGNDRWYGSTRWGRKSKQATHLEYMLDGSRYPGSLSEEDRRKYQSDEAYRINYLQDAAVRYLDKAKTLISFLEGSTSVLEAAQHFDDLYIDKDYKPTIGTSYDYYKGLNKAGKAMDAKSSLWGGRSQDWYKLRSQSDWTEHLIEKEATIALPTRADALTAPKLDRVTREGLTDQRKGANVTPDDFKNTFGFADVGFGTWVASNQDQDHLNYGYDALMDLANHFGTDPKNIGFGKQLHFTIGALGHGKASAHFWAAQPHPDGSMVQVINLTNTKGDGTVYHEWIHALDHNLGGEWRSSVRGQILRILKAKTLTATEYDAIAKRFLVGGSYWRGDKNADKVDSAIKALDYYMGTGSGTTAFKLNADKLGKDYWGNEQELIARAAEAWAADTLGGTDSYLVNPEWVGEGKASPEKGYRGTPYPTGHERQLFNQVYTALAKAVKWEGGKPTVTLKDFREALPENPGEDRRKFLSKRENMQQFYDEIIAERDQKRNDALAADKEAKLAEQQAMDEAAAEALKELATVDAPTPAEVSGELSEDDLSALFDQAAAELREENQEKPLTEAPGESPNVPKPAIAHDQWTVEEINELLEKSNHADMVALGGGGGIPGVPTIHELSDMGETKFMGFGAFETRGVDANGKSWSINWDGGGEMRRLSSGKPYTNVSYNGPGTAPWPSGVQRAIEKARDDMAEARSKAANLNERVKINQETKAGETVSPTASSLIAEAAKLGVKGADEALKGLAAIFGAKPGRLNSFPGGFDEEAYQQAKPHFTDALKSFQDAGKTLVDLFKMLINQFGDGIKEYAVRFAKDEKLTAQLGAKPSASSKIADKVQAQLENGAPFDWRMLFTWSDEAFGGTQGESKYTPKDAYDAMEMGVNRYLMSQQGRAFNPNGDRETALLTIAALERITGLLPTQSKRTAEQDEFQQFSTVPALAFAANWVANITSADTMMEPSGGIGGLAVFAKNAGANLILNELSSRRAALLQEVFPSAKVFSENAEQIDNILPVELVPSVVVMNPPFSSSSSTGVKSTMVGARHVEQAMSRLADGGRLVAIVGEGMTMGKPAFKDWWKKISAKYDVRAVIPMDGSGYAKYGTTFDNAILVIDKVKPSNRPIATTKATSYNELVGILSEIRNDRPIANIPSSDRDQVERDAAESALGKPDESAAGQPGTGKPDTGAIDAVVGPKSLPEPNAGGNRSRIGGRGRAGRSGGNLQQPGGQPDAGGRVAGGSGTGAIVSADGASGLSYTSVESKAAELTESVFESYQPQRLRVEGAKQHPGPLVQSAAMASVLPPAATYTPNLPTETINEGKLSIAQIESVVYAGQAHQEFLNKDEKGVEYRRGFFIGDGCVAGETRIYDPVSRTHTPIKQLAKAGKPITVLSLTTDGLKPMRAMPPFKKGIANLFRVVLEDGREVTVTDHHRFFTPAGWTMIAAGLRVGHSLASVAGHPASSLGFGPSTRIEDDLHSTQTVEGCLERYLRDCRLHGERLLGVQDSDQSTSQQQGDALEHSLGYLPKDALELSAGHTRQHQAFVHLSKNSFAPLANRDRALTSRQDGEDDVLPLAMTHQSEPQSQTVISPLHQPFGTADQGQPVREDDLSLCASEAERRSSLGDHQSSAASHQTAVQVPVLLRQQDRGLSLAGQTQVVLNDDAFSCDYYSRWNRITSIEFVRRDEFFDMYVPGPENYVAEGIIHHNTGVGKGREIGGIMLDNIRQGRTKHVWVTEKQPLLEDAKRDFKGVGGDASIMFPQGTSKGTKSEEQISAKDGIVFTTYSTLRSGAQSQNTGAAPTAGQLIKRFPKGAEIVTSDGYNGYKVASFNPERMIAKVSNGYRDRTITFSDIASIDGVTDWNVIPPDQKAKKAGQSRLDQLVNWLGKDFDGVIAFDEAHNAGNAVATKGERGTSTPAAQAMAVVELQKRLPKARIVYVSATGATQVSNLSFATRLGLWGAGTPFASVHNFVAEMTSGGLATMELVARDMKQMGSYIARALSFNGVSYSRVEHELTDMQKAIYNRLAEAWQVTLQNFDAALEANGSKENGAAKSAAKSAYWGAQQRFFNQIITSMQMPTVLEHIEQDIKNGDAVVLQLVNTNEAQQKRAIADRKEEGESTDLEDLDLTPRDQLMQMIEKSYPVVQYEKYTDEEGKSRTRPVMDSEGMPVLNRESVAMRERLLQDLKDIKVPDGPLEIIINHFGVEKVSEVTGRTQRVVNKPDTKGVIKAQLETRGSSASKADAESFLADKKQILVFSDAGGTGYSFHADLTKTNQRKRQHYLLQPGWRADKAVQGLGRTHRTNQKSEPHYKLASTNIPSQKRFLSAIARRLDMLGALTKGQRDTANQGLFSEKDNLESTYATQAVRQFIMDLRLGQVADVNFMDFLHQTGLEDIVNDQTGQIAEDKIPTTRLFLNRMLSLTLDMQYKIFNAFISRMEEKVEIAAQRGELDAGLQTIKALSADIVSDDVAYTDQRTGATTRLVELELTQPTHFYDFPIEANESKGIEWVKNTKSGRVWGKILSGQQTLRNGAVVDRYRMRGTGGTQLKPATDFVKVDGVDNYAKISKEEAQTLWEQENAAKPATYTEKMHMVVGAVLPIWDRLKTSGVMNVSRTQTTDGQRLLGMVIAEKDIADIRKRLNVSSPASKLTPDQVMASILKGETGELANGWKLKRARVSDDLRIEIEAGYLSAAAGRELISFGVTMERIAWKERYFVPTGKAGVPVLEEMFKSKPLIELSKPDAENTGAVFSMRDSAPEKQLPLNQIERLVQSALRGVKNAPTVRVVANPEAIGLSRQSVQDITDAIKAQWANAPDIVVASNMADPVIPQAVRDEDAKQKSMGATGEPEGFYHGGKVYVVAGEMNTASDVIRVLLHETLGHAGLRGVFGKDLETILRQIVTMRRKDIIAKARGYGLVRTDKNGNSVVDVKTATDAEVWAAMDESHKLTSAEEVLAEMAQTRPEIGFVTRAVAAIRAWLRKHVPGFSNLTMKDSEIIAQFLLPARRFIEGRGQKQQGIAGQLAFGRGENESTATDRGGAVFSRTVGGTLSNAANNARDVKLPAGYVVGDFINSAPGKLGWWHKTVGTQYHLAQKSPAFKRVFDAVQTFLNDVSYYATEAADLAPNILPKLETWKDIGKSPVSAADTKAFSAPVFEGTLNWGRDESGRAVKMEVLEAAAAKLTVDQKARRLLRGDHISEQVLKMWQGLQIDQYESMIEGKYARDMLKPGIVFTDAELKQHFNLTPNQVKLYREFRKATDKSLTNLAIADMLRFGGKDVEPIRETVLEAKDVTEAADTLSKYLLSLTEIEPDRSDVLTDTANKMIDKGDKAEDLIKRGYAPLSRFGQYTLDVVDANGERVYFGMFESKWEAAKMNREMRVAYPGSEITQGTVSEQAYKLFAGVSPETLELFGDMLGLEAQGDSASAQAFQEYLKLAKSNRSAMKRLIQRKGIAGFNEDAGRVLAGFVYSNARQTSSSLHMGEMTNSVNDMPKQQGELKDAAVKLVDYIKNPQEEAQALRGLLFAQYIGGSIASAMVNMTQPLTMTFPWLAQFGGVTSAAKQMAAAVKDAGKPKTGDIKLDAALKRAEEDGTVSPQEVHQLQQQAQGRSALQSGDGTTVGNAIATANNTLSRIMLAWGKPFSWAEQLNRRITFIAAYRTAVSQKMSDPDAFARRAISETQGVYNKGNKPQWARGAIGSTLFTFKQYSIAYIEMLQRMSTNGPEGKKAALLALAVLFLLSGAGGMPGADDLDDLISGAMQSMGYNFDSKSKRKEFFVSILGEGGANFVERGVSGLPGVPIDVSGRMGLGNLVPGTGLFTKKIDHTRDVAEFAGPAGDLIKRGFDAGGKLLTGDVGGAANSLSPKAIQNIAQAYDMANMGMYRDAKGMKVLDTNGYDALAKAIGFQPTDVKRAQDASFEVQRMVGLNRINEAEIANKWALGMFEKNPAKVQEARDDLKAWNDANPESRIVIKFHQIMKRVSNMRQTKAERIAKTSPKEIRAAVRKELEVSR